MHEFFLAKQILDKILTKAKQGKSSSVKEVIIKLPKISGHDPKTLVKNLKFNLKLLSDKTLAKGAKFLIKISRRV